MSKTRAGVNLLQKQDFYQDQKLEFDKKKISTLYI